MKNPNWRSRGNSESEEVHPGPSTCHGHFRDQKSDEKPDPGASHATTASDDMNDQDFVGLRRFGPSYYHPQEQGQFVKAFAAQPSPDNESKNLASHGYCELVSYHPILNSQQPLSLIELRPVEDSDRSAHQKYLPQFVEVSHISTHAWKEQEYLLKKGIDEQNKQFAAALGAVQTTPQKVPSQQAEHAHARDLSLSRIPRPSKSPVRQATQPEALQRASSTRRQSSREKRTSKPSSDFKEQYSLVQVPEDTAAFEKMLGKLRRPDRTSSISKPYHHATESNLNNAKTKLPMLSSPEKRGMGGDQRPLQSRGVNQSSSGDSGYESMPSKDTSQSDGSAPKASNGIFNPRAREFLSLSDRKESSEDSDMSHGKFTIPLDVDELFERPGIAGQNEGPHEMPAPPYPQPFSFTPMTSAPLSPQLLGSLNSMAHCVPVNVSSPAPATWGPGQLQPNLNFSPNAAMLNSFLNPCAAAMINGLNLGCSPLPNATTGVTSGFMPISGTNQPPISHMGTGNCTPRPGPVPKPRIPDPGNQQAYEAWIEWRKANEPGYAMECKLRQQRRSQRNAGTKVKSDRSSEMSAKAEVATAS